MKPPPTIEQRLERLERKVDDLSRVLASIEQLSISIRNAQGAILQAATKAAAMGEVTNQMISAIADEAEVVEVPDDLRKFFPPGQP